MHPRRTQAACRFCAAPLDDVVADLGMSPLANAYVPAEQLSAPESFYPLRAFVCAECLLVQLEEFVAPETLFSEYHYFTSYSSTALAHARGFVDQIVPRLGLDANSRVVEVASNDGYLLQFFRERGIPVLGVEPSPNVAAVAIQKEVPTLVEYFGVTAATELRVRWPADLLIANNVLPHVPMLNDFVAGLKLLLADTGTLTIEFGHLLPLLEDYLFDTIYHEHFQYFSLHTAQRVLAAHDLECYDVEQLPTHGGSLRLFVRHVGASGDSPSERMAAVFELETAAGLERISRYRDFADAVVGAKLDFMSFLIEHVRAGHQVVGYGAPAKAATLLNYCGVGPDMLPYTVDASPHKQGRYVPGVRIPIKPPSELRRTRPDVVVILPWNLREEVIAEHAYIRDWGGRFAIRDPSMRLLD